ncbi:molybdopterin-dependent oxidoreductase [Eggerthella sp. NSJ-70]|uniref:Molybdopterin-dependent oxidoreductase n=1 Tax=Eggerthella hominis TaxID=2763043 RepID=A0ABR7BPE5_9ACTN|nr:molybdopterin-dependent oxidoreductase [Eggerthella hominis]MBC5583210.1 molybdopterin-dependent oxidoreductase [Eggerthella hominis]
MDTISRRTFTKVGLGAALAASLAPGTLVGLEKASAAESDADATGVERIRSHCRACGKMECPIWVSVRNGRVIKVEGDNTAISSHGNCCSKGRDAMQALYHPDRVKYPMKRTNPKGEDPGWVRISWDEAMDTAVEEITKILENPDYLGWHSIKILHGTGRTTTYGIESFPSVVGMSNVGSTAGQICKGPRIATGAMIAYPSPHWVAVNDGAKCFFQWGTNQEVSNYDTAGKVAVEMKFNSDVSIVVGPRLQNLGKECTYQLHLRPGTDDALAQGLMNVIIENKKYDEQFLKRWTNGVMLVVDDLEPEPFEWTNKYEMPGAYPLDIKTRLLKQSDVEEGGDPRKFMVWNTAQGKLTYFDAPSGLWEGETEPAYPDPAKDCTVRHPSYMTPDDPRYDASGALDTVDPGFPEFLNLDPALEGEYQVTLKDGRTVKAVPAWQRFCERIAYWTPERTAEHCWVDADLIRETALAYAKEPSMGGIQYNLPIEHTGNAAETCRTILCLSGITNNVDTFGGNRGSDVLYYLYNTYFQYHTPFVDNKCTPEVAAMCAGAVGDDLTPGGGRFPLIPWSNQVGNAAIYHDQATATDMILTGKPYPIRGMISCTGSHFHCGNAVENWEAFKTLDFYLGWELWWTPTVELADVVLPARHFLENSCVRASQNAEGGFGPMVKIVDEPLGESRWDSMTLINELAPRLKAPWWPADKSHSPFLAEFGDTQWPTEQQALDMSVVTMKPMDFMGGRAMQVGGPTELGLNGAALEFDGYDDFCEKYQEHGQWSLKKISPFGYYKRYLWGWLRAPQGYFDPESEDFNTTGKPGPIGFPTPTGKFELWSTILESYPADTRGIERERGREDGYLAALPTVREPYESPYQTPEVYEEYPLIMTTGRRNPLYFHSEGRQQPYLREQYPVPHFQIHPDTAAELGIEQGDWCWIESRRGRIRETADLFAGIDPRIIEADHGWWYPELPAPKHGWDLSNINVLVDQYAQDPHLGSSTLRSYLVKVYKCTEENCPDGRIVPCDPDTGIEIITSGDDPRLKEWLPLTDEERSAL